MKTLYFECTSGISGDMTVAALLDLGADPKVLQEGLASLGVSGFQTRISRVNKSGIDACDFDVILDSEQHAHEESEHGHGHHSHEHSHKDHHHSHSHGEHVHEHSHPREGHDHNHDGDHGHGHEYSRLFHTHDHSCEGHDHPHTHPHEDGHAHGDHDHGHSHSHEGHSHGGHDHVHRNLGDILALIDSSAITDRAKDMAKAIFRVVAEAEAKVHGKPLDQVHFHEVGAVDSIVDIVGAAICVDNLGVDRIACSPLREGTGMVKCQHGLMPVPAPATLEIISSRSIPLIITDNKGEMVTPTGAAIVAALAEEFAYPQDVTVNKVGYGAGKREYKTANVLRAMILEAGEGRRDLVLKMECNLDDMTGEELSYACEKLLEVGALDVWCAPIYMKKGRPGQLLSVLIPPALEEKTAELLFTHTTTIGVRVSEHRRHTMERRETQVETPYGQVAVKESVYGNICKSKVEFESAKQLAAQKNLSITQINRSAYTKLNP